MFETSALQRPDNTHRSFIEAKIPDWLTQASAQRREALQRTPVAIPEWYRAASVTSHATLAQAVKASWLSQTKVDRIFERLADVRRFAEPLLRQALKDRFDIEPDVSQTYLRLYLPKGIAVGYEVKTLSLLDAALHNFEKKESVADYFDAASCFISEPDTFGHFDILALDSRISISAFVSMCRELDIGGQYSQQLETLLLPKDAVAKAVLEYRVKTSQKDALRAAVLLARMKGDIGADSQALLMQLLDGIGPRSLQHYQLQIMEARLSGIMLLAEDLDRASRIEPVLVYIPEDPQHPIKEYSSTLAFRLALTEQLRSTAYQRFFARFVAHEQRGHFFAALDHHLNVVTWHRNPPNDPRPAWRRSPAENPDLRFGMRGVQGDPWQWLYQDKLNKVLNDARVVAVPTADEDRKSRWALWDSLENVASIVVQVATLVAMPFVPLLGELMLAYTAWQLLDETFTGILDWTEGQTVEAAGHLLSIAQSLAQLAAFGAAAAVAGRVLAIKPSAFVENLKPVELGDGHTRLWNPDLTPYEKNTGLPTGAVPDELGLHRLGDKSLLALEGRIYEVSTEPGSDAWYVRHPQRTNAYRPRLRHNGAGAWTHEVERPMEWQGAQLFRRLGHSVAGFSDTSARNILAVSGIDEATLRHMHVHAGRPPALLEDAIRRFGADQQIQAFIAQLRSPEPAIYTKADPHMQLQLLQIRGISVPERPSGYGDVLRSVIETLDDPTLKKILGESPAFGDPLPGIEVRIARLRARMVTWAQDHRADLFKAREAVFEQSSEASTVRLRRVFPEVPKTIAQELWRNAGAAEHLRIQSKPGITPQMAHEALFYLREVRLSRACEGIYLDSVAGPDSDRLALHMLETLNGWSPDVRIEVRADDFDGALLDSIGRPGAAIRKVLVRQDGQYQAYDGSGDQLNGLDTLYGAVMHALPDAQRSALGLPGAAQGGELQQVVRRQPLLPRTKLRTLLGQPTLESGTRSPMGLAVGRAGYLLGGGEIKPTPPQTVEQRLRTLYPTLPEEDMAVLRSERLAGNPFQAIARLEREYLTLIDELELWVRQVPSHHPLTAVALDAGTIAQQTLNRQAFMEELKASWSRRQTPASPYEPHHFYLYLDVIGELPELSADFGHVTELVLGSRTQPLQGHGFLKSFTGLQFLTLEGVNLHTFPAEIFQMRKLVSLTLNSCALQLSEATAEGLSLIEGLKLLSLNDNPLGITPHVGFMKGMRDIYLRNCGLTEVPSGLFELEYLARADLTVNEIIDVPEQLFDLPDTRDVDLDMSENPLSLISLCRIKEYLDNSSLDRKISIRFDEPLLNVEEIESDFEEDDSDSALGSDEESDGE